MKRTWDRLLGKPAIQYLRASTNADLQRNSFGVQGDSVARWADINGYNIQETFSEYVSASKDVYRREWKRALQCLRDNPGVVLIIHDVTRATRSLRDWAEIESLLPQIRFASMRDEPVSMVMLGILISLAQEESNRISKRVTLGIAKKRARVLENGEEWSWGNQQLGTTETAENGRKANANKAADFTLSIMLHLRGCKGATLAEMVAFLNNKNITTRRGKSWTTSSLHRVIKYAEGLL
jgi:DNA invertase Pin-like site-specific DNA recombinase